jgi:putative glutamine amidotransferase
VALGGSLHQHLGDVAGLGEHGAPKDGGSTIHDVKVLPGSRLAKACGGADLIHMCTSHHHQGIDRLAEGLTAVGWSDDGLIEAVEADAGSPWVLGVQWHPEMTAEDDPVQQGLFDAFAAEIKQQ